MHTKHFERPTAEAARPQQLEYQRGFGGAEPHWQGSCICLVLYECYNMNSEINV